MLITPADIISWHSLLQFLAVAGFLAFGAILFRHELRRTARESRLQAAFQVRTRELDRERLRERARSEILEQLVSNQPLGGVLDGIAGDLKREIPGCLCCIFLRRNDSWRLVAAPGVPPDWSAVIRSALSAKDGLPVNQNPDPAIWQSAFASIPFPGNEVTPPRVIHARLIGNFDSQLGLLVAFETLSVPSPSELAHRENLESALQSATQLAFVAIEHWRFYEDLRHRAHHDSLTGLPNRVLLEDRLAQSLSEAAASRQMLGVLSIDIDRFKRLNDLLGHRSADVVLVELATRIRKSLRAGDIVARVGGDEFMVIVCNVRKANEVDEVSLRILEAIRQPMLVAGRAVSPTASVGSAVFPSDAGDSDSLRRKADGAMRCAKGLGRNQIQSFGVRPDLLDRDRLEEEIRDALEFDRFTVHYQPKIGAAGCFCGLEALVRLTSDTWGAMSPAVFIPVAEESGLIHQLGAWVLVEVCRQMVDWHTRGLGWVPVAVNVSPAQISRPGFAQEIRACLQRFGVPPASVELELTESIVLGGGEEGEKQMRELRTSGIRFSIDDFGTGYSSLSYLYRLPVDAIKLDRSFVQAISTDDAARRLVQAMIGVAAGLGLDVVAEGVETEDQRVALIAAGCPVMQGYFFARPAPAAEIESFLVRPDPDHFTQVSSLLSASDDLWRLQEAVTPTELQAAVVPLGVP